MVKHIVCTEREVNIILNVERLVCKEMGYKNTWELSCNNREFNTKLMELVLKYISNM